VRHNLQKFRAILESGAVNEAARRRDTRKGVERCNEIVRVKSPAEPTFDKAVRGAKPARIQIVEKVGGERPEPGPPRRASQGSPRGRRDQNRGTSFRRSHARD
jgi:hypothetical protein